MSDLAPGPGLQTVQCPGADAGTDQTQRREPDRGRHPPDLPVAPLLQAQLDPAIRNRFSNADRRRSRPQRRGRVDQAGLCRPCRAVLQGQTVAQGREVGLGRAPLDLGPVDLLGFEAGIGQALLKLSIVGEDQKALTVPVEATRRVDTGTSM